MPARRGEAVASIPFAELRPEGALLARPFSLTHDVFRPLVGSEPEVDGLAQFALTGPFREFALGNQ